MLTLFRRVWIWFYGCKLFTSTGLSVREGRRYWTGNTLKEWYSSCRSVKSIQTRILISKIDVIAEEIEIDEEKHAVGGVLRRQNGMGLQRWSSSEVSQLCNILICGNLISFAAKVGRCVRDEQDIIKPKETRWQLWRTRLSFCEWERLSDANT